MFDGWDLVAEPPPTQRDFRGIVVAGRRFAVPADAVRGELSPTEATMVPGSDDSVRGVLMWEGQVVPVLATAIRLELPVLRATEPARPLLQLEVGGEPFFLEVDAVEAVISGGHLEPPTDVPMVAGFIDADGDRVPVLDLDVFTDFSSAPRSSSGRA